MKTQHILSTGLTHGICITQITIDPNESTEKHFHKKTTEVYSVTAGDGLLICGETKQNIEPGSIVIIEPNTPHQIVNTGFTPLIVLSCKDKPRQTRDYYVL